MLCPPACVYVVATSTWQTAALGLARDYNLSVQCNAERIASMYAILM
jgi:hypothetical protein